MVGELERMAERFVQQGIGTSPVASRAIQQAQLQGPSAALAESEATRSAAQRTRLADFAMRLSKNLPTAPKLPGGGFNKMNPFYISNSKFNSGSGAMPNEYANIGKFDPRTGKVAVEGLDVNDPKNKQLIDLAKQQVLFNPNAQANTLYAQGKLGDRGSSSLRDLALSVGDSVSSQDLARALSNLGGY